MLKKIPRQVVFLGLISLFTDMASEMLYPITPIFLASVLGASMVSVGLIEGLAEITAGFLKGYFGFLSDKLGKRSMFVVGGYSISALSKPLPGIFPQIFVVLISRVTDRIGKGIRTAPRDALLAGYSSSNNTGAIFGFHRGMDTLGAVLGPLIALLLLRIYNYDYKLIFIIAFFPSIIAVTFTFFVKDKKVEIKKRKKLQYIAFWKESPHTYKTLVILITVFSLVNSSDVFLILKSRNISHSDIIAILGYVFYNLIYAGSSYPAGLISDKIGKKKIYILGLIIFSAVYFGFASSDNFILTWILFAFYGIYAASTEGILKAWISDLVAYEKVASAVGFITMLSSIAMFSGSILTGYLWDAFGSSVPFYVSSAVSLI
ncbi:MAG: MFS transporter, partial [Ignavibacteriaceae bacterium]